MTFLKIYSNYTWLFKKTFWESANLADLSGKVVVSQTLPVSGFLPARELETTEATLNSRKLEVKIGHLRNINLQLCNSLFFPEELTEF